MSEQMMELYKELQRQLGDVENQIMELVEKKKQLNKRLENVRWVSKQVPQTQEEQNG